MIRLIQDYQLDIMLVLLGICMGTALYASVMKAMPDRRRLSLLACEFAAMILLLADRAAYLYRGDVSRTGFWMVRLSNFLVFFMTLGVLFSFTFYLEDLFVNEEKLTLLKARIRTCYTLLAAGSVLLVISQFTGLYYSFDVTNHYQRSQGFIISYAIPLVVLVLQLSVILQYRKRLRPLVATALVLFTVLPLMSSIIQIFTYGISLTNMTIVVSVVLLVALTMQDMNSEIESAHALQIEMLTRQEEQSRKLFDQLTAALANAIDAKDRYTRGHSARVAEYSRMIAERAGKDEAYCDDIYRAAMLHDLGKIGIPDRIINKKGKLTDEEYAAIKKHPAIGRDILDDIESESLWIGANYHHERYDGSGYPSGINGEEIPELARIIAVADAYDAMTSNRSYRKALPQKRVRSEIEEGIGTQFDPHFGSIMLELIDEDRDYRMREH